MSDKDRAEAHPDSPPEHQGDARDSVEGLTTERSPLDSPGVEDGVAGTGGANKAQDNPTS